MVVGEVIADVFDGNIMGHFSVMALAAAHQIVGAIDAQVQGGIFAAAPAVGLEHGHIHRHGAIVAGKTEQADGAGGADLVVQGAAVVEIEGIGGGTKAVPALDAPEFTGVGIPLVRWNVAVHTGRSEVRKCHRRHSHHAGAFVEPGEVMLAAEEGATIRRRQPEAAAQQCGDQPDIPEQMECHFLACQPPNDTIITQMDYIAKCSSISLSAYQASGIRGHFRPE